MLCVTHTHTRVWCWCSDGHACEAPGVVWFTCCRVTSTGAGSSCTPVQDMSGFWWGSACSFCDCGNLPPPFHASHTAQLFIWVGSVQESPDLGAVLVLSCLLFLQDLGVAQHSSPCSRCIMQFQQDNRLYRVLWGNPEPCQGVLQPAPSGSPLLRVFGRMRCACVVCLVRSLPQHLVLSQQGAVAGLQLFC